MGENIKIRCPVCSSEYQDSGHPEISCNNCGFRYAFVHFAAGETSRRLLCDKIAEARHQFKLSRLTKYSEGNRFILTSDSVAFISLKERMLSVIYGNGRVETAKNVLQYSASERNSVVLFENGKIKVLGDNNFRQCNVQNLNDIVSVLCAPNCIYAIDKKGKVNIVGAAVDPVIKNWTDISALSCGAFHVLGLTKDKKVKIAGEMIEKSVVDKVSGWKNVKSVTAATDCSIALFQNGTAAFAGRKNDPRSEVESWTDIISISADSSYAIGLTRDGAVRLAGFCKPYLDMGRSLAREWKNLIAVTCSRSGIAAISDNGELSIAGNFSGDLELVKKIWLEKIRIE